MSSTQQLKAAVTGTAPENPFKRDSLPSHVSAGTVAIESERAIAEAQGKLVIAKRFPRDEAQSYNRLMQACSRPGLADEAIYSFPRGGQKVEGPSIRLAEELARCWGNIDYGLRELSRRDGESEMEAYAWDMETNTISSQKFTVRHFRDRNSSNGGKQALTDERDIYEIGANMGARRLRARILAIIPGDLAEAAVKKCRETLDGNSEIPLADRIRTIVVEFGKLGIQAPVIERRIGKKLDSMLPADLTDLRNIFKSLRDNMSKPEDWFGEATGASALAVAAGTIGKASAPPAETDDPAAVTVAEISTKLASAANVDDLDSAYDMMSLIAGATPDDRKALAEAYQARRDSLEAS
jgi:hypothetical protein